MSEPQSSSAALADPTRDPFPNRPRPDLFFPTATHRAAWRLLREAAQSGAPAVIVTGPEGSGKSMLALSLVEALGRSGGGVAVPIAPPSHGTEAVMRRILLAAGHAMPPEGDDPEDLTRDRVLAAIRATRSVARVVLVIDAVQDLDPRLVARLMSLTRPDAGGPSPVSAMLFARADGAGRPAGPALSELAGAVSLRHHLRPLDGPETRAYIAFHLRRARRADGADPAVFDEAALTRIETLCAGNPARINSLCGICLCIAVAENRRHIDGAIVGRATRLAGLDQPGAPFPAGRRGLAVDPVAGRAEAPGSATRGPAEEATTGYPREQAKGAFASARRGRDRVRRLARHPLLPRAAAAVAGGLAIGYVVLPVLLPGTGSQPRDGAVATVAMPPPGGAGYAAGGVEARTTLNALLADTRFGLRLDALAREPDGPAQTAGDAAGGSAGDPMRAGAHMAPAPASVARADTAERADRPLDLGDRRELEALLAALAYETGPIDGVLDARTRDSIRFYKLLVGLHPVDDKPSHALLTRLRAVRAGAVSAAAAAEH